jgi:hypothetical protein
MTMPDMDVAGAWAARSAELAAWAARRLVNRADVYGGYHALADRDKIITRADGTRGPLGATTTRPARALRGQVWLTATDLEQHFCATGPEHVVGLHTTHPDNTSKWGAVEVDWHGPTSTAPEVNWRAALAWFERLRAHGFHPLLSDSNGKGGYHLLVLFSAPVATAQVFAFARWLTRDHAALGLTTRPETFPKQCGIAPGRCGNWLRLPGRHHTREHWSRVWDGSRWLDGAEAVAFILSLQGDPPDLIPDAVHEPQVTITVRFVPAHRPRQGQDSRLDRRILGYIDHLPAGLTEGQGRDDHGFRLAAFLVRDLALSDDAALQWMQVWDDRNAVAKGTDRLQELLDSARLYGRSAAGSGLVVTDRPRSFGFTLTGGAS